MLINWDGFYLTGLLLDLVTLVFGFILLELFEDLLADGIWSHFPLSKGSYFEALLFLGNFTGDCPLKDLFF
jgi:hypothetical protein